MKGIDTMPALVAKSFEGLPQLTEPYEVNGKMYVKVRTKSGTTRQVRAYNETEYKKYNPEVKIIQKAKPRWEVLGFGEKRFIWLFKGNTYAALDWFRASPCRFARPWGWYLPSDIELPTPLPAEVEPIKLMWDQVSDDDVLKSENDIQKIVESMIYDAGNSEWIGEVGERLTLTLICTKAVEVENMYGTSTINTLEDENGNVFVWSTSARSLTPGYYYEMTGKIKDHSTFRNVKQNILTNCRIKNEYEGDSND
jgi:hypothetical protein